MTFEDFMYRFKEQEEVFKKELLPDGKTSYPYIKPTEHRVYQEWLKEVVDPSTEEHYQSHDNPPRKARMVPQTIVRIRLGNGEEKLYSVGKLVGYNSFGDEKTTSAYRPQVKEITQFGHETKLDKDGRLVRQTKGPERIVLVYDKEFTPENVDELYKKRDDIPITFIVRDEIQGLDISVRGINERDTLELFKYKDFDYLYSAEYKKQRNPEDFKDKDDSNNINKKK